MERRIGLLVVATFLSNSITGCMGLSCYSCRDSNFNGENSNSGNCFQTSAAALATRTATCNFTSGVPYCETTFTIQDGVVTAVSRGCASGTSDVDLNSDSQPSGNICHVLLDASGNPTANSKCYVPCSTSKCNTATATGLKACTSSCSVGTGQGGCDYITGRCICKTGFGGPDCSIGLKSNSNISCYQCTSETDKTCATSPSANTKIGCPGTEKYCATTKTTIFNRGFAKIATVVTRGCSDTLVAGDECAYTNIYDDPPINSPSLGYSEYTCYSTCDTSNCNGNDADGVIDAGEGRNFQCVQCSGNGNGVCEPGSGLTRSMCGGNDKYCKTTVTYLLSMRNDIGYKDETPPFKIANITRECTSQLVATGCTATTAVAVGTVHTCTETCQTDGCNTGWPARPKCIQCSTSSETSYDTNGFDQCLENPPVATDCPMPFHQYCYIHDEGMIENKQTSLQGYPRRITRGCSFNYFGSGCSTQTILDQSVQTCNRTCTWDGCNYGNGSDRPLHSVVSGLLSLFLALLTQMLIGL